MKSILKPSVVDAGHTYNLLTLDGDLEQTLTFVKRFDPTNPSRFPGNTNAYPGTTMQSVIRCLIERIDYLQGQIPHVNNLEVRDNLLESLWLLEQRAAERHGYPFMISQDEAYSLPMCQHCGHVICIQLGNSKE